MENKYDLKKWSDEKLIEWRNDYIHSTGSISFEMQMFAAEVDGEILRRNI